ncbi:hypothetical protein [Winogradskyella forsetii]|uniref:hypothetical protein n=1 Tax=Winogradskyella forsetii TaxID=2686077 RepID=UPI0015BBC813|nr:hypothetical protein [Winogradskyella forsetii]
MKNLLNLGKALNKAQQKQIFGGMIHLTKKPDTGGGGGSSPVNWCDDDPTCCETDAECPGTTANGEWLEGFCQITAGGSGVCVLG